MRRADPHQFITQIRRATTCASVCRRRRPTADGQAGGFLASRGCDVPGVFSKSSSGAMSHPYQLGVTTCHCSLISTVMVAATIKPRPHQQQCRSNIVECYQSNDSFDKVERCFDTAAGVDGAIGKNCEFCVTI